MYKGLNRVFLTGRIREVPTFIPMQSGGRMAVVNLDVEYDWNEGEGAAQTLKTRIETHPVAVFNPHTVDYIEKYLKVGHNVLVEGTLQGRTYQAKDGTDRHESRITVGKKDGKFKYIARAAKGEAEEKPFADTITQTAFAPRDELPF